MGQRLRFTAASPALPGAVADDWHVVGVARDVNWRSLAETPRLLVYVPYTQYPSSFATFVARTSADAEQTARALETAGHEVDAELSIWETKTMAQHLSAELRFPQLGAILLSVFAMLALLLAAIGLYGVVSYAVASRTREVGIRMALGATTQAITRLLAGSGVKLVLAGCALGVTLSFLMMRLISSLLFGVEPTDAMAFIGAPVVLLVIALAASYLPARRASRASPVTALRAE